MQTFLYIKLFPHDSVRIKATVSLSGWSRRRPDLTSRLGWSGVVGPRRCALALEARAQVPSPRTLDTTHSLLVYTSIWIYLITNFGDKAKIDTISVCVCNFDVYSIPYEKRR